MDCPFLGIWMMKKNWEIYQKNGRFDPQISIEKDHPEMDSPYPNQLLGPDLWKPPDL
jgi:hypothetical protein